MTVTGHEYRSTRVRGLADWKPKPATLRVVTAIRQVLAEYETYLPLTARQVFYRLVGAHDYPKTERAYKRLLEYLNRARRAELIPFDAIRDDGFTSLGGGGWSSPQAALDSYITSAQRFRRWRQEGQPQVIEVWCEAAGMMPQLANAVADRSIRVFSSGGFNSTTAKYETAQRIARREKRTVVLHVGDYDPSGVAIVDSLASDIDAFLWDLIPTRALTTLVVHRVAVTPEQIDRLDLPGAPPKVNDRRGDFNDEAVQAEAISPDTLRAELLAVVEEYWDWPAYDELLEVEEADRALLVSALEGVTL